MKPIIAITIGDINGVGPEVALRSLKDKSLGIKFIPLLVGPIRIWEQVSQDYRLNLRFLPFRAKTDLSDKYINVFDVDSECIIEYGKISKSAGFLSGLSIFLAYKFCKSGLVKAMVTAPISKEAMIMAGFPSGGHTEMLGSLSKSKKILMVLLTEGLKVGLVTTHLALNEVSKNISKEKIIEKIEILFQSLKSDFKVKKPAIAVLGMNPHSGDGGILGREELDIIIPAIKKLNAMGYNISGPFPADGFFARYKPDSYDAVVSMYHDQGLIPLKMIARNKGVNFTAGLDVIRTSPDHGTAFNIAGQNIANPESMKEAIKLAIQLAKIRDKK